MRQHNFTIIALIVISSLAFIALLSQPLTAKDEEILRLRQRITELENRIKALENFYLIFEESQDVQAGTVEGWQNKKNWRRLETGMTKDQVQSILGKPIKTIKGVRTLWYYPNIYRGYVSFDENGRLIVWSEP